MNRQKAGKIVSAWVMAAVLLVGGCSGAASPPAGSTGQNAVSTGNSTGGTTKAGGTLTYALDSDIVAVDPAFAYDFSTMPVVNQITEGLLKFDKDSKLIPNLAEKWENPDPLTYFYHIRTDVKFQDGTPMTADDVIFSMERIRDPKTASYVAWLYENVDKIEKTDEWTVKVTLTQPDAQWKFAGATTACHVISKKYFEAHKDNFGKPEGGLMGTGPFKFASWQTGSEIVLEKNPDYWNKEGGPYLDKVVLKVIPEGTTRVTGLKTGQINMAINLPLDLVPVVDGMDNVQVTKVDSFMNDYIAFNTQVKPLDDVKVRQAINYALDKQKIKDQIVKDTGTQGKAVPVAPAIWTYAKDKWEAAYKELPDYAYNLDKAKQLMAESSVPNGFSAKILTDGDTIRMNGALALQAAVKPLGIHLEIEKVTGEELSTRCFSGERNYEIMMNNWGADFPDPASNLLPLFHSKYTGDGGSNFGNYKNPQVDKLLDSQSRLNDDEKRADLLIQAEKIIASDTPWIMLNHPKQIMAATKGIQGYTITPLWYWDSFLKDMQLNQ
ncbi:MAG: hypothetical protein K0R47_3582 [Brevibacillus sp.]|nr:hypothetical protein [Brevibacillus sp.]